MRTPMNTATTWLWLLVTHILQCYGAISLSCDADKTGQTRFMQLPGCQENHLLWSDTGINAPNLLDCARHCARREECLSFYYVPEPPEGYLSCGVGLDRLTSCFQLYYYQGARFYVKPATDSTCDHQWTPVLHQYGSITLFGNLTHFIERIEQGSQVRIIIRKIKSPNPEETLYDVDSVWVNNSTVTAQIFTWTWDANVREPVWTKLQVNTLGLLMTTYYNRSVNEIEVAMHWYVQKTTMKCGAASPVLLEMYPDGQIVQGSLDDLQLAVVKGFPLQMVEMHGDNVLRSFPVSTASVNSNGLIELHSEWLGESSDSPNQKVFTNEMVTIAINVSSSTSYLSIDIDIMDSKSESHRHGDPTRFLLATNFCWEKIYVGNYYGQAEFGSINDLIQQIYIGMEQRVVYQCNGSTRALSINRWTSGDEFLAYSTPFLTLRNGHSVAWESVEVNPYGQVSEVTHHLSDGSETRKSCHARILWFGNSRKRDEVWYYHQGNEFNAESFMTFDSRPIDEGYLPIIIRQILKWETLYSFRSQSVTVRPERQSHLVIAVSCRSFNGRYWHIVYHNSLHYSYEVGVDIDNPGSIGYVKDGIPFWSHWYL